MSSPLGEGYLKTRDGSEVLQLAKLPSCRGKILGWEESFFSNDNRRINTPGKSEYKECESRVQGQMKEYVVINRTRMG